MNTIGYVFLLTAALIINSVARGRVMELPSDLGEAFTAAITGEYGELKEVLTRKGDALMPETVAVSSEPVPGGATGSAAGSTLLTEMKRLAVIANNRYVLGTTGPNAYDCSGLVWRACKNIGIYTGARFTTHTFPLAARSFAEPVSSPAVGDIVLWTNKHMGVVSGKDKFYSARNRKSGIGEHSISGWPNQGKPRFFRINKFSLDPNDGKKGHGLGVNAP